MDSAVVIGGIIYGLILIVGVFLKSRFTEPFRIDSLISAVPSEKTRPLNLVAGICFAGYGIYTLIGG